MKIAIFIFLHVNTLKIGLKREEKCLDQDEQYFCDGEKCGRWNCSESKARVKKFLQIYIFRDVLRPFKRRDATLCFKMYSK